MSVSTAERRAVMASTACRMNQVLNREENQWTSQKKQFDWHPQDWTKHAKKCKLNMLSQAKQILWPPWPAASHNPAHCGWAAEFWKNNQHQLSSRQGPAVQCLRHGLHLRIVQHQSHPHAEDTSSMPPFHQGLHSLGCVRLSFLVVGMMGAAWGLLAQSKETFCRQSRRPTSIIRMTALTASTRHQEHIRPGFLAQLLCLLH